MATEEGDDNDKEDGACGGAMEKRGGDSRMRSKGMVVLCWTIEKVDNNNDDGGNRDNDSEVWEFEADAKGWQQRQMQRQLSAKQVSLRGMPFMYPVNGDGKDAGGMETLKEKDDDDDD